MHLRNVSMTTKNERNRGWTCIELQCSGRQLETARISFTPNGVIYRVSCGPLGDKELERLDRAAVTGEPIRLLFPRSPVMLADVTVDYPKPGWAVIEGRVVGPPVLQPDASQPPAERGADSSARRADDRP